MFGYDLYAGNWYDYLASSFSLLTGAMRATDDFRISVCFANTRVKWFVLDFKLAWIIVEMWYAN